MAKIDIEDTEKKQETVGEQTQGEAEAAKCADAGNEECGKADSAECSADECSSDDEKKEQKKQEPEEDNDTRYLRLMADFQNYKKRVEKEKTDLYSYANEKLITEMLDVIDNFERALEHEEGGDGFKKGMEMIFKQLSDVFAKAGLAEIPALGEEFDPNFHNAVMTEETEEYESGKVSGVMQKGYTLNGKVIRPSMVKVVS